MLRGGRRRRGSLLLAAAMLFHHDFVELVTGAMRQVPRQAVDAAGEVLDPFVDVRFFGRGIFFGHLLDGAAYELRARNAVRASKLVELPARVGIEADSDDHERIVIQMSYKRITMYYK